MQFATAKHINRIWRLLRSLLLASDERIKALEKILHTEDAGEDLFVVTDAEYRILAAIDRSGRSRFPAGLTSRDAVTENDHEIRGELKLRGARVMESDDYGIFYILDSEERILFMIDQEGSADFKGVPRDVRDELDSVKARLDALENQ